MGECFYKHQEVSVWQMVYIMIPSQVYGIILHFVSYELLHVTEKKKKGNNLTSFLP